MFELPNATPVGPGRNREGGKHPAAGTDSQKTRHTGLVMQPGIEHEFDDARGLRQKSQLGLSFSEIELMQYR